MRKRSGERFQLERERDKREEGKSSEWKMEIT